MVFIIMKICFLINITSQYMLSLLLLYLMLMLMSMSSIIIIIIINNNINNKRMMLPPGFRFCPYDINLIRDYLMNKIAHPNLIGIILNKSSFVNVIHLNLQLVIQMMTVNGTFSLKGTKDILTARDQINQQEVDNGKQLELEGKLLILKESKKTDWIVYEYEVHDPTTTTSNSNSKHRKRDEFENTTMRLDGYVFCKISRSGRSSKSQENEGNNVKAESIPLTSYSTNIENILGAAASSNPSYDQSIPTPYYYDTGQAMNVADGMVALGIAIFKIILTKNPTFLTTTIITIQY
ncbi:hypothetical protein M9H77_14051 [Catharanthus roseus]|uniref:Uncharacterized protein n=1 Tax=Catharanthus roseus TaxID=4058 RepID=A0ACC0BLX2_CATRO|nr:hypothetical protein M9H77_14051 [Catharanthus roseus]